jgi:hypothetical protein
MASYVENLRRLLCEWGSVWYDTKDVSVTDVIDVPVVYVKYLLRMYVLAALLQTRHYDAVCSQILLVINEYLICDTDLICPYL